MRAISKSTALKERGSADCVREKKKKDWGWCCEELYNNTTPNMSQLWKKCFELDLVKSLSNWRQNARSNHDKTIMFYSIRHAFPVATQHTSSILCQKVPEHISEECNIVWSTALSHYRRRGVPAPLLLPLQWSSYTNIFKKWEWWDQKHVLMGEDISLVLKKIIIRLPWGSNKLTVLSLYH